MFKPSPREDEAWPARRDVIPAQALSRSRPPRRGSIRWSSSTRSATSWRPSLVALVAVELRCSAATRALLDRRAELFDLVPRLAERGRSRAAGIPAEAVVDAASALRCRELDIGRGASRALDIGSGPALTKGRETYREADEPGVQMNARRGLRATHRSPVRSDRDGSGAGDADHRPASSGPARRGPARASCGRRRPVRLRDALDRRLPGHGPDRQPRGCRIAVRAEGRGRRLCHLPRGSTAGRSVDPATTTFLRPHHGRRRAVLEDRPDAPGLVRQHRGADVFLLGQFRPVRVLRDRALAGRRPHHRQEDPRAACRGGVAAKELDGAVDATLTTGSSKGVDRGARYVARCGHAVQGGDGPAGRGAVRAADEPRRDRRGGRPGHRLGRYPHRVVRPPGAGARCSGQGAYRHRPVLPGLGTRRRACSAKARSRPT